MYEMMESDVQHAACMCSAYANICIQTCSVMSLGFALQVIMRATMRAVLSENIYCAAMDVYGFYKNWGVVY